MQFLSSWYFKSTFYFIVCCFFFFCGIRDRIKACSQKSVGIWIWIHIQIVPVRACSCDRSQESTSKLPQNSGVCGTQITLSRPTSVEVKNIFDFFLSYRGLGDVTSKHIGGSLCISQRCMLRHRLWTGDFFEEALLP